MKLVFAGTPEFAAAALTGLLDAGHEVAFVLTQPDRPAGRGLKFQPSAVKLLAQERGLFVRQPAVLDDAVAQAVRDVQPEAIVVAAYGLIVPPALLGLPRRGCLEVVGLLQMPGWSRRLRIMIDWSFALLFRPDIVKISLDSETVSLFREAAAGAVPDAT